MLISLVLLKYDLQKLKGGLQKPTDAALKPGNRLKNKYKDMYACELHLLN